ncbi:hypothetical protein KJ937_01520, partial [Patescibacteria group bacterium]|nr:hypothetical protein [Patescibacteria group bacterium]
MKHDDAENKHDEELVREATEFFVASPTLMFMESLLTKLRQGGFSWWNPLDTLANHSVENRMCALSQRPDLRQKITTELTGLKPR